MNYQDLMGINRNFWLENLCGELFDGESLSLRPSIGKSLHISLESQPLGMHKVLEILSLLVSGLQTWCFVCIGENPGKDFKKTQVWCNSQSNLLHLFSLQYFFLKLMFCFKNSAYRIQNQTSGICEYSILKQCIMESLSPEWN